MKRKGKEKKKGERKKPCDTIYASSPFDTDPLEIIYLREKSFYPLRLPD